MGLQTWKDSPNGKIQRHAGTISAKIAEQHALSEFEKYRVRQDQLYQSDFDRMLLEMEEESNRK